MDVSQAKFRAVRNPRPPVGAVYEGVNVLHGLRTIPSSAEEGWPRHQDNVAKPPYWSGRGGVGQEMNLIEMDQPPRLREFW